MTKQITIRGTEYTYKKFSSDVTSVAKASDKLAILANAAAYQAVAEGNLDWMNRLFQGIPALTLKSGELSKQGKELRAYIVHHAPSLRIELAKDGKNAGNIVTKLTGNKDKRGLFVTGHDDDGNAIYTSAQESPDFYLTFSEWREYQAPGNGGNGKRAVKSMTTSVGKLLESLESGEFNGDYESLVELAEAADKLKAAAAARYTEVKSRAADVCMDAAMQAETGSHKGKAPNSQRRAGKAA